MTKIVRIALAGNPNAGKSTVFNYYTGARQHVGNYPGVTVERREGTFIKNGKEVRLLDLPGTYSLTAYSCEEIVTREELLRKDLDVAISIINAGAIERNLYLVIQLLEMGIPLVVGVNMMDEAKRNGICLDTEILAKKLGVDVVPLIAREGKGLDELLEKALTKAEETKDCTYKPLYISYGTDLDPVIDEMETIIQEEQFLASKYLPRWVAIKYIEGDTAICTEGKAENPIISTKLESLIATLTEHLEKTLNTSTQSLIADYRYGYISSLMKGGAIFSCTYLDARLNMTEKMDSLLTHKILGPILMLVILYLVYHITFLFGAIPQGWLESGFSYVKELVNIYIPESMLKSLLISGILDGIGGILSFVPLVLLVFLQIAFLEDSGYMARIAYMLDRVFRIFGLHGYSAMPLILSGGIAGGCAIPGIMAARTLRSPRERLATILATPYMACGAKLPVFILFVGIFFVNYEAEMLFLLTVLGWVFALVISLLLRKTLIKGDATPFIMELPPYRWPTFFGVCIHALERIWQYIKKAGTVILMASILLWAALTFPNLPKDIDDGFSSQIQTLEAMQNNSNKEEIGERIHTIQLERAEAKLEHSFVGSIGIALEPVTQYMGFTWRTNVALLGGIAAKELTIATLGIAYSLGEVDEEHQSTLIEQIRKDPSWTTGTVWAFLLFVLLYAPCLSTLAVMKQETGTYSWVIFSLLFNTAVAYGVAVLVRSIIIAV